MGVSGVMVCIHLKDYGNIGWVGWRLGSNPKRSQLFLSCIILMKLYKISQNVTNWYDTYDSAVVCADNFAEARETHPCGYRECIDWEFKEDYWTRCKKASDVEVEYIWEAEEWLEKWVIVSSFNAW